MGLAAACHPFSMPSMSASSSQLNAGLSRALRYPPAGQYCWPLWRTLVTSFPEVPRPGAIWARDCPRPLPFCSRALIFTEACPLSDICRPQWSLPLKPWILPVSHQISAPSRRPVPGGCSMQPTPSRSRSSKGRPPPALEHIVPRLGRTDQGLFSLSYADGCLCFLCLIIGNPHIQGFSLAHHV